MFYRSRDMNGPPTDNRDDQLEINYLIRALRRPIKTKFGEAAATLANKPLLFVQERRAIVTGTDRMSSSVTGWCLCRGSFACEFSVRFDCLGI